MIDEIQDRNSRKNLYDALKDSYDLGSFEQFDKDMQSQEARKNLWDAINADYDVGTFEQFDKDMMGDMLSQSSRTKVHLIHNNHSHRLRLHNNSHVQSCPSRVLQPTKMKERTLLPIMRLLFMQCHLKRA